MSRFRWIPVCALMVLASCSASINDPVPAKKLKILGVFGHMGKSHFDIFKPLLEELARRGHDLTVISYFPRTEKAIATEPLPNYKDISLLGDGLNQFVEVVDLHQMINPKFKMIGNLVLLHHMASMACEAGLNNTRVKELVKSGEQFDLVLTEAFNTHCFFAVFHRIDAPFIEISTHLLMPWVFGEVGFSHEASHVPALFSEVSKPMSFLKRLWNVVAIGTACSMFNTIFQWTDQSLANRIYGPEVPNLMQMSHNVSLVFVNTHFSLFGARVHPPNVVEIGGIHIPKKTNPLPKDIAKFLDQAHEGVLYFNLGSMVKASTMPEDKLTALLNVLGSIPRKVIWKWENDDMQQKPKNFLVKKWLPQFDVMNHPNVKCYFGHGGLLGLSEGVHSGLPMILMPLFGDQYQNSVAAEARGVAVLLEFSELNEENLRHAVDEIFNNTRYMENAKRLSKAYRDRPTSPLDTAVWWSEYIGRGNGLPYIKSDASQLPWYVRNLVDVIAVLIIIALVTIYAIYKLTKYLLNRGKKVKVNEKDTASKKRN
ncbi:UDP-glycosyltransferase UGT5 isoform X2 [Nomia melanderi]|uniref:UDP-glycosyltransferase UGT5 isoform X2 n=1 Tax=Nomia melanderi TaxID=2448451 RepID=UPI0013045DF2|nr:UDP-glucuronosyltransferase 1-9-like [Nomia melanderi]